MQKLSILFHAEVINEPKFLFTIPVENLHLNLIIFSCYHHLVDAYFTFFFQTDHFTWATIITKVKIKPAGDEVIRCTSNIKL